MQKKNNFNLFNKKLKKQQKIIPLNTVNNSLNYTRHFPSATREWFNSIYAYNNNNYKYFIKINENLSTLIKGYFYMFFNKKFLSLNNKRSIRIKRLSLKRIFIGKMELKHTSDKIIITVYVYNEEKRILIKKLLYFIRSYLNYFKSNTNSPIISISEKLHLLNRYEKEVSLIDYLKNIRSILISDLKVIKDNIYTDEKTFIKEKVRSDTYVLIQELQLVNNIIIISKTDNKQFNIYNNIYGQLIRKDFLEKEIKLLSYYKLLLLLNQNKFKNNFLNKLKILISKLLNKKVELNIVNQKSAYLNSDFFTEAIAIKLRRRKNKLLRVLKAFLRTAKIPKVNKIKRNSFTKRPLLKKVNDALDINEYKGDLVDNLLLDTLSYNNSLKNNLEFKTIKNLKYKQVVGIRLEAKGRLTKRFTASRSLFKVKWKGSVRNIDSSYKGLSSVILKGNLRSNLQYSLVNSKTRNGAFGLKGWMSGN